MDDNRRIFAGSSFQRPDETVPNLQRFVGSINVECPERMLFFGERALQSAATSFPEHYPGEPSHKELRNRLIEPGVEAGRRSREMVCPERLGGPLRYHHRAAA